MCGGERPDGERRGSGDAARGGVLGQSEKWERKWGADVPGCLPDEMDARRCLADFRPAGATGAPFLAPV